MIIIFTLSDAKRNFLSYTVDVLHLSLVQTSGAVIKTLPLSTRIDFSQYTGMTEFLTSATIPAGNSMPGGDLDIEGLFYNFKLL